ncbi:MAG TPA: amino acid transport protein [Thermoanaerobaculia bacterium]
MILFLGLLFGAIGGVYAFYGRKNYNASFLVCGVLLMIYPYVVPGAVLIFIVGIVLVMIPIALAKGWL